MEKNEVKTWIHALRYFENIFMIFKFMLFGHLIFMIKFSRSCNLGVEKYEEDFKKNQQKWEQEMKTNEEKYEKMAKEKINEFVRKQKMLNFK